MFELIKVFGIPRYNKPYKHYCAGSFVVHPGLLGICTYLHDKYFLYIGGAAFLINILLEDNNVKGIALLINCNDSLSSV